MKKRLSILMVMIMIVFSLGACTNNKPEKKVDEGQTQTKVDESQTQTNEKKEEAKAEKLKAVVTILPQAEWVKAVAGDLVEVSTLLPPGASPEVYQASPKEMIALEDADVYFTISVPVEVDGIIPNTTTQAKKVNLAEAAAKVYPELSFGEDHDHDEDGDHHEDEDHHDEDGDHHDVDDDHHDEDGDHHDVDDDHHDEDGDHHDVDDDHHDEDGDHHDVDGDHHDEDDDHEEGEEHHHHHSGRDPHVWMSPKRVMVMVETIRDTLMELDAANAETYKQNAEVYLNQLKDESEKITDILSKVETKSFIIMHPSMGYFADEFGLEQVSIEKEGKQATAEHLKHVIDFAKEHNIKVIFYQKEFDNNQAKTIASEVNGEVMELEPLAPNYLENLNKVAEVFNATLNK